MDEQRSIHGQWRSGWTYFLVATGSAVGLGNIWKFPYIVGEYGGGAFVLVYLACIAVVGLPVLIAEVAVGRSGRKSPFHTLRDIALADGGSAQWRWLGLLASTAGLLILSFYTVIAGWSLFYIGQAASGGFDGADAAQIQGLFAELTGNPWQLLLYGSVFLGLTMWCVGRGVERGIEVSMRYMMPLMVVLLLLLVGYAMSGDHFEAGLRFLFTPDFSRLTMTGVLVALGHAFFTLSLGAGAMMIYGAYVPPGVSLPRISVQIAVADVLIALLAGLALFPLVFAAGLSPGEGPGLAFVTLPLAFGTMPFGALAGTLFFVMLALAAFSSTISMIEAMVATVVERWQWSRPRAVLFLGLLVWLLSLGTVLSFNLWQEQRLAGMNFFEAVDALTSRVLLPLASLGTALFAGWVMTRGRLFDAVCPRSTTVFEVWYFLLRYVSPLAILLVFLNAFRG